MSFTEKTANEVTEEAEQFQNDIIKLKHDFRRETEKLENLEEEYQDSKAYTPSQRYVLLKTMIKRVIRTL